MCGRFMLTKKADDITIRYRTELDVEKYSPIYNAAPSMSMPVITNKLPHKIQFFRWGLIPHWSKDEAVGYKMINARAETLKDKISYKNLLKSRRCLVIADGFYEWKKKDKLKIPYCITLKNNKLFSFAGLWDSWTNSDQEIINSFSIITTAANPTIREIHDRMPVILNEETEQLWISDEAETEKLLSILKPLPSDEIQFYTISSLVNSPLNNSPEILNPYFYD